MLRSELEELIKAGKSTRQIAEATGNSQTNVRYWLKKFGIGTNYRTPLTAELCSVCGDTEPDNFYASLKYRCKTCHDKDTTSRGKERRKRLLDYMGGACAACGFDKWDFALQIHHRDPSKKDPNFQTHRGWGWERAKKEVESCVLLCSICHSAVHMGVLDI